MIPPALRRIRFQTTTKRPWTRQLSSKRIGKISSVGRSARYIRSVPIHIAPRRSGPVQDVIEAIVEILGEAEVRLTSTEIVQILREQRAWDFGSAEPVYVVDTALIKEKHTSNPRIIQFMGRYTLRRAARNLQLPVPIIVDEPAPRLIPPTQPAAAAPPVHAPTPELTGESPRLLLDLLHGARLVDHLDGRTVAAVVRSGCAELKSDWLAATESARPVVRSHLHAQARASGGRRRIVFTALAELVDALPAGAELSVRNIPAAAVDVLLAIYDTALVMDR